MIRVGEMLQAASCQLSASQPEEWIEIVGVISSGLVGSGLVLVGWVILAMKRES